MRKRLIALLSALILFLTGCTNSKSEGSNDPIEVLNTSEPTKQIEETISMLTKETEPIIIEETTVVIETQPIIETEPIIIEETKPSLLTLDEIALEVIGGKWGSGDTRRNALREAGYNYEEVAQRVNEIIAGSPYEIPDRNTFILNFAYVPKKVDVYDEFGNVEGSLSQYQKVLLTDTKVDGMTLVHFKDQTFYLKDNEYKLLSDSHIEIDISEQKVYMYINGELILEANVVTGHPDKGSTKGTNLGRTEVYAKSYNVTFDGGKSSDMFILFNWDGEGFHDAGWREDWEFDDNTRYLTHGSNGCANMRYEDVEVIEENSYLGMHVLVHK